MRLLLIVFFLAFTANITLANTEPVHVISSHDGLLYLKIGDQLLGGSLKVMNNRDSVIEEVKLDHRRVLIDFFTRGDGQYRIMLVKQDLIITFQFVLVDENEKESGTRHDLQSAG